MTEFTKDGLYIDAQDLNSISPSSDDNERMYHHDGSASISMVGGGSTSERGYYVWDSSEQAWYSLFNNADKLDGKESGAFVHRDGSLAMQGDLDFGHNGLTDTDSLESIVGRLLLNSNNLILESKAAGADVHLKDSNGLLLLNAQEGGNVNAPNGTISEQGARVATRTWTENNADVPNADYADNANQLDGYDESAFLHVSGDQMEGLLSLGANNIEDGGDVLWDSVNSEVPQTSLGGPASSLSSFPLPNSDLSNSSVTVNAGNQLTGGGSVGLGGSITVDVDENALDADTLDGAHKSDLDSQYVDASGDTMSGFLTLSGSNLSITGGGQLKFETANQTPYFGNFSNASGTEYGFSIAGTKQFVITESSNVGVPNGTLSEQGNRVATRAWTDANADVPNADYADNAGDSDTLDGEHASAFADAGHLHDGRYILESGDTMTGVLTLSDGSTAASQSWVTSNSTTESWVNNNADVPNADYADSAGDADTLDGEEATAFADVGHLHDGRYVMESGDTMSGNLTIEKNNAYLQLKETTSDGYPQLSYHTSANAKEFSQEYRSGTQELDFKSFLGPGSMMRFDANSGVVNAIIELQEGGSRVATRSWTNANADVPNADFADTAGDVTYDSYPLSIPVTKWANGLSDVEIHRVELSAGESLEVHRLEVQPKGGGDVTGLDVDVFDETNATVIASTTDVASGSPIGTSGDGANVIVRISNSSGSSQNASIGGQIHIV